jgi:hypothetical protein
MQIVESHLGERIVFRTIQIRYKKAKGRRGRGYGD